MIYTIPTKKLMMTAYFTFSSSVLISEFPCKAEAILRELYFNINKYV